ncbi:hypothetical protein OESDEN_18208 [Oesophagostomum dentatum]|uniref:SCP domain-containing protein n=1 Tax=Oesophagostomum dentatum TaxID=61180 RepID=A0A0B1SFY8_OESDE|nr:hypothetical protein OESDEN_18208 [Oesophagostomum dentatum]
MAWAKTRYLGCAIGNCSSVLITVCSYKERGNILYEQMYNVGEPGSECPDEAPYVSALGLCV